jgi:capsid protein
VVLKVAPVRVRLQGLQDLAAAQVQALAALAALALLVRRGQLEQPEAMGQRLAHYCLTSMAKLPAAKQSNKSKLWQGA